MALEPLLLIVVSSRSLESINLDLNCNTVLCINKLDEEPFYRSIDSSDVNNLYNFLKSYSLLHIVFISKEDKFDRSVLKKELHGLLKKITHIKLTLLIPHLAPPEKDLRLDGKVRSFLLSGLLRPQYLELLKYASDFSILIYFFTTKYLNSSKSKNIEIFQVGRKDTLPDHHIFNEKQQLKDSMVIIPHKGSIKLLKRCLNHLNMANEIPSNINLCFDDTNYKNIDINDYPKISSYLNIYANQPLNVGPYLPRHYSIMNTANKYIFFQDSDDISIEDRFGIQLRELKKRKLDMIGSHEIRIDEIEKEITIIRFPLDVNMALNSGSFHTLFHPTSLITKKAYLKTKGFSTNLKFGYDSQFLLRSKFFIKIGNIDEFLYLRFKRSNSLTTSPKTKLGSEFRSFLNWRWMVDTKLIRQNKLCLTNSSLWVQKHEFDYKLVKVPSKNNDFP